MGIAPLHYTQLTSNSNEVWSSHGMEMGPAVAINIPTSSVLGGLSSRSTTDLPTNRQAFLNTAIQQLVREFQYSTVRRRSGLLAASYMNGFDGGNTLGDSNIVKDADYLATLKAYTDTATSVLKSHSIVTSAGTTTGVLDANGNLTTTWANRVATMAFRFGLAEFLVKKNLSTVVEFSAAHGDFHDMNDVERVSLLLIYICYNLLIERLSAAPLEGGGKLLDVTTVVMHSEFDRDKLLSVNNGLYKDRPGTNHWGYGSALISGAGVKKGIVFGDYKTGPSGLYAGFSNAGLYNGLPIDVNTGKPSPTGVVVEQGSFFPTMMGLLGVTVPSRQITGASAIPGIIKL